MTRQDLIDSIRMTNNGYIFIATMAQLDVAKANPDIFAIFGLGMNQNPKIGLFQSHYPK
jgi:hypothetical protein